jgi:hypothetical protein
MVQKLSEISKKVRLTITYCQEKIKKNINTAFGGNKKDYYFRLWSVLFINTGHPPKRAIPRVIIMGFYRQFITMRKPK